MMLNFSNGSSNLSRIDWTTFDGVVAGYWLSLWEHEPPTIFSIPNKIYRSMFLYGNKHHKPHPDSGCETLVDWVGWKVGQFPQVTEWVLVNEFTDDFGNPYTDYKIDDLKRYFEAAYLANPNAKLILGDFKPYLLSKWDKISAIADELKALGFPVEVGVQNHLKHSGSDVFKNNAPIVLGLMPELLQKFNVPVHFFEVSLWYKEPSDLAFCGQLWNELISIGNQYQVKSFCPWWLYQDDTNVGRRMPTFEGLTLYSPISQ